VLHRRKPRWRSHRDTSCRETRAGCAHSAGAGEGVVVGRPTLDARVDRGMRATPCMPRRAKERQGTETGAREYSFAFGEPPWIALSPLGTDAVMRRVQHGATSALRGSRASVERRVTPNAPSRRTARSRALARRERSAARARHRTGLHEIGASPRGRSPSAVAKRSSGSCCMACITIASSAAG
jgi:hypothetical protein